MGPRETDSSHNLGTGKKTAKWKLTELSAVMKVPSSGCAQQQRSHRATEKAFSHDNVPGFLFSYWTEYTHC